MFSVAFLEASINQLFIQSKDENASESLKLGRPIVDLLATLADIVERAPTLQKYQVALTAAGKQPLRRGEQLYQDVESLVKVRNAIVHYRAEWDNEAGDHRALEHRLNGKFRLNGLVSPNTLWFPHRCLGVGCASWGVDAATNFSQEFCHRLSIPQRHE